MAALPDAARAAAHIFDNGEVGWPNEHAEAAINALADSGKLIERARREALAALPLAQAEGTLVLVSW